MIPKVRLHQRARKKIASLNSAELVRCMKVLASLSVVKKEDQIPLISPFSDFFVIKEEGFRFVCKKHGELVHVLHIESTS